MPMPSGPREIRNGRLSWTTWWLRSGRTRRWRRAGATRRRPPSSSWTPSAPWTGADDARLALVARECQYHGAMVEQRHELGLRKAAVLNAVVEEYVRSGEPVGSETIADGSGLGVSSATIRNEMAALEELGFLSHPHTSAGRIPTDLGYRHYVDTQPHGARLRDAHRRAIAGYFAEAILDLEEVLKGSVQLLSRLTQYAGLAVPPGAAEPPIVRISGSRSAPSIPPRGSGRHRSSPRRSRPATPPPARSVWSARRAWTTRRPWRRSGRSRRGCRT